MARNTSVILGEHFDEFIKAEIKSGRYGSTSEIIRSGLRMLEDEKRKIESINKGLVVGEESGKPRKFNNEKFKVAMRNKFATNV